MKKRYKVLAHELRPKNKNQKKHKKKQKKLTVSTGCHDASDPLMKKIS